MSAIPVQTYTLPNELVVIVEHIPHVQSVAYDLTIPGGIVLDDHGTQGASLILAEHTCRGAGALSSRELSDSFDSFGVRHSEGAGLTKFSYRGSLLAEHLEHALRLVALMVTEPQLPPEEIDPIRSIFLQDIRALQDNPARLALLELGKLYYPKPYGRPGIGTEEGISAIDAAVLQRIWSERFGPKGAILSIAGNVTGEEALEIAQRVFSGWQGANCELPEFGDLPSHSSTHIAHESAQTQIGLAYPSAKFGDEDYYVAKVATGVLSGGMFGRLFIEVREKRGLCYSVFARHSATQNYGTITAYAGTTPERAGETLEVLVHELANLRGNVTEEELARSKANILSAVVIGEESTSSRAISNGLDRWLLGRVRSLAEVKREILGVTLDDIDRYLERYPVESYMLVTLGSDQPAGANRDQVAP